MFVFPLFLCLLVRRRGRANPSWTDDDDDDDDDGVVLSPGTTDAMVHVWFCVVMFVLGGWCGDGRSDEGSKSTFPKSPAGQTRVRIQLFQSFPPQDEGSSVLPMNIAPICLAVTISAAICERRRCGKLASGKPTNNNLATTMMLRCLASTLRRQHRRHHIRAKDIIIHDAVVAAAPADAVSLAPLLPTATHCKRDYPP